MGKRICERSTIQTGGNNSQTFNLMNDCVHYWIIEAAAGPHSDGVCRRCGASRQFDNAADRRLRALGDGRGYRWRDIMVMRIRDRQREP
jgi:hypothetical protein